MTANSYENVLVGIRRINRSKSHTWEELHINYIQTIKNEKLQLKDEYLFNISQVLLDLVQANKAQLWASRLYAMQDSSFYMVKLNYYWPTMVFYVANIMK